MFMQLAKWLVKKIKHLKAAMRGWRGVAKEEGKRICGESAKYRRNRRRNAKYMAYQSGENSALPAKVGNTES
jgi:hypothetical protein